MHLAGLTPRQTRDGLRKLGVPEFFISRDPPTREGTDRMLAFIGGLLDSSAGMERIVVYRITSWAGRSWNRRRKTS